MNDQQQVGYTAPTGEMTGAFIAPQSQSGKTKRKDIQVLPQGLHPAVIFSVVDLGTHSESYMGETPTDKKKIFIGLEFPQLKQRFYEEDEELKSTVIFIESTFAMNDKAKLRKIVEAVCGRKLTDQEAYSYDVTKILGARILINVAHNVSKKTGKTYAQAESFMPLAQYPLPVPFDPSQEYWSFYMDTLGNNFKTINFAKLPAFLKKKIIDSKEGKIYASKGGLYSQMPKNKDSEMTPNPTDSHNQTPNSAPSAPPQAIAKQANEGLIMLTNDFTYEQYKSSGWTDEMLIEKGKAKRNVVAPPIPAAPPIPQSPPSPFPPATNGEPPLATNGEYNPFEQDDDVPF